MKNKKIIIGIVVILICILVAMLAIVGWNKGWLKFGNNEDGPIIVDTQSSQETEQASQETEQVSQETEQPSQETEQPSQENEKPNQETEQPDKSEENTNTQIQKPQTENSEEKVIYLTFDDGPGPYTQRLLDILDEYGIKVTFFVTNCSPQYQNMIGEAYRRGHTIALHTYNHYYSNYSSEELYYQDLKLIHDVVVAQTGVQPTIMRFPGGSSNTKSKQYCEGIMTILTQGIESHGYKYCDWNVSSGDGNSSIATEDVINNVIKGVSNKKVSVVLQHDPVSTSVEAVDDIIRWGLENGYTFKPMTDDTQMIHHTVAN